MGYTCLIYVKNKLPLIFKGRFTIVVAFLLFLSLNSVRLFHRMQANTVALDVMRFTRLGVGLEVFEERENCITEGREEGILACSYNPDEVARNFRQIKEDLCKGLKEPYYTSLGEIVNLCHSGLLVQIFVKGIIPDQLDQLRIVTGIVEASQESGDADTMSQALFAFWSMLLDALKNDSDDAFGVILCDSDVSKFIKQWGLGGKQVWSQKGLEIFAQIALQRLPAGQCRSETIEWAYAQNPSLLLDVLRIEDMRRSKQWSAALKNYQSLLNNESDVADHLYATRFVFTFITNSAHKISKEGLDLEYFPTSSYCAPYDLAKLDIWLALHLIEIYKGLGYDVQSIESELIEFLTETFWEKSSSSNVRLTWGRRIESDWVLEGMSFPAGYTNWYDEVPVLVSLFKIDRNGERVNSSVRLIFLHSIIDNPDFDWTLAVSETDGVLGFDQDVYPGSRFRSSIVKEVVNGSVNQYLLLQNPSVPMLTGIKTHPFVWPSNAQYVNIMCVKTESLKNVVAAPAWRLQDSGEIVIAFERSNVRSTHNNWSPILNILQSPNNLYDGTYWLVNSGTGGVGFDHVLLAEFSVVE